MLGCWHVECSDAGVLGYWGAGILGVEVLGCWRVEVLGYWGAEERACAFALDYF